MVHYTLYYTIRYTLITTSSSSSSSSSLFLSLRFSCLPCLRPCFTRLCYTRLYARSTRPLSCFFSRSPFPFCHSGARSSRAFSCARGFLFPGGMSLRGDGAHVGSRVGLWIPCHQALSTIVIQGSRAPTSSPALGVGTASFCLRGRARRSLPPGIGRPLALGARLPTWGYKIRLGFLRVWGAGTQEWRWEGVL